MHPEQLDQQYWNSRYREESTGWDIGAASPPLVAYFDQLTDKSVSILIPGCGNAHEAEYLLTKGFTNITLVDISPMLITHLKKKFRNEEGKQLQIIQDDFFNITGSFDLIVEQTFFCALRPNHRERYCNKMSELLKPKGKLVGLLFDRMFVSSPPFGGTEAEYVKLFSSHFYIETMGPCTNSIAPRQGSELFFIMQKL